jgi:hypothetical protein
MNDNTDELDELVSRYLDAEVTADETAHVESDPKLLARADAMRAAIEAIATPVDIPTADLDRRRTIALDAHPTSAQITDLSTARARTVERRNRFVAVAAGVVLLAVAFTAIQRLDLNDDDQADFATESTESGGQTSAAVDDALEMFSDDMALEEAPADTVEEAAEMDDRVGAGGDAAAIEGTSIDMLPDELAPVETAGDVVAIVDKAYADVPGISFSGDPFDGICPEAIRLITDLQPDTTVSVESAVARVDAELLTVMVALTGLTDAETDAWMIVVHPVDDCAASTVISPESP